MPDFDSRGVKKNKFLRTNLVTRDVKEAILRAVFSWRPYVLRAYCDTNMIIAESKGKIRYPYLKGIKANISLNLRNRRKPRRGRPCRF